LEISLQPQELQSQKLQLQLEERLQRLVERLEQENHGLRYQTLDLFQIRLLHQLRHLVISEKLDF